MLFVIFKTKNLWILNELNCSRLVTILQFLFRNVTNLIEHFWYNYATINQFPLWELQMPCQAVQWWARNLVAISKDFLSWFLGYFRKGFSRFRDWKNCTPEPINLIFYVYPFFACILLNLLRNIRRCFQWCRKVKKFGGTSSKG